MDSSPVEKMGSLKCSASPSAVSAGKPVTIKISGIPKYKGRIQQVVQNTDKTTTTVNNITLVQSEGKIQGNAGTFTPNKEGNYKVTVKTLDYTTIIGSCGFKVLDPCPQGTSRLGGYVAFIVDNSESHNLSDCPKPRKIGVHPLNPQDFLEECTAQTEREKAVEYATSVLGSFGSEDKSITSMVSFANFPNNKAPIKWMDATTDRSALISQLQILRRPYGVTPYNQGLKSAIQIFRAAPPTSNKTPKILVFITDGFPTDKNPKQTLALASQLKNQHKVKILSVMITGKVSQSTLREKHKAFLREFPLDWMDSSYQRNHDAYILDLLGDGSAQNGGLLKNMSDSLVFVEESNSLGAEIDKITARETLTCQ